MKKDILSVVAIFASVCATIVAAIAITRGPVENENGDEIKEINERIGRLDKQVGDSHQYAMDHVVKAMESIQKIEAKVGLPKSFE